METDDASSDLLLFTAAVNTQAGGQKVNKPSLKIQRGALYGCQLCKSEDISKERTPIVPRDRSTD